jgi:helix-turn-helix protein
MSTGHRFPKSYVTVARAAEILGVRPQWVRWLIKRGRLKTIRLDGASRTAMHLLRRDQVLAFARKRADQRAKTKFLPDGEPTTATAANSET